MKKQKHKVVIVGAGMAGLTAAAYLSKEGQDILLIDKGKKCGGLLNSFQRDGFLFDAGARSIENSGIIRPMLKQLGIDLELLDSPVSIGIEDEVINLTSLDSLQDYERLLKKLYPESLEDINRIISFIKKILKDMAILYGIDNPFFRDLTHDKKYLFAELLPWFIKFQLAIRRINKRNEPVEEYLKTMSSNHSLIDIISQHFFKNTPTFFALGYFYVYLDYFYPKGGTGQVPASIEGKIKEWGGNLQFETEINEVISSEQIVKDTHGKSYSYDYLIWAADLKRLYEMLKTNGLEDNISRNIDVQKEKILESRGGESVFTLFLGIDENTDNFRDISNGHFFYTPSRKGMGEVHRSDLKSIIKNFENTSKDQVLAWLDEYCRLNTYEISIPSLRDPSLSPDGKTGMIASLLFDSEIFEKVQKAGWHEKFKTELENRILDNLSNTIYPGLKDKVILRFSSSPLTIIKEAGTSRGAITGWTFESTVPVIHDLRKMRKSIHTPIPRVYQAGQWAYSPAGIPTASITGWLAAQQVLQKK
jgi:phytoene dehydrogenase-like protein